MEGCSFVIFANTASNLRTLILKDHLDSKKYAAKKEVRKAKNSFSNAPSTSQQIALGMISQGISLVSRVRPRLREDAHVAYLKRPT